MNNLDTPMFRAQANIVDLSPMSLERARTLEHDFPDLCCVSEVSPSGSATVWKGETKSGAYYFYYVGEQFNEEWIKTGKGERELRQ